MRQDKRKLKRQDIFLIVEFKSLKNSGGGSIGITRELSTEGFSMEAQNIEFKCGDVLEFTLKHSSSDLTVTIEGEVAWKNHSWYKYLIGVKFLEVTEEQRVRIEDLMSAIRDATDEPNVTTHDEGSIPETGEKARPAARLIPGQKGTSIPREKRIPFRMMEQSELTGRERNFISGEKFPVGDDYVHEEGKPASTPKETGRGHEMPDTAQFDRINRRNNRRAAARRIGDNIYGEEKERKKKIWVYAPLVTAAAVILFIALPVMIKSFNAPSPEAGPALLEPTITGNGEHEQALGADDKSANNVEYVSETPGPDKAAHALKKDPIVLENDDKGNVMQLSSGEDFTGRVSTTSPPEGAVKNNNVREIIPDVPGEDSKIDLIAKIDETIKTVRAMQQEKPVLRRRRPAATWTAYGNEDNAGIQRSSIDEERGWSTEPQETVTAAGTIETSVTDIPEKNETADEPAPVVMAEEHAEASPIVMAERPPEPETITIEENLNKIDQPLRGGEEHKVGLVVKNKKSSKTRLLAKIETPRTPEIREKIKTPEPAATQQLAPKIALLVKGGNFNKNKNISRGRDNTSRSNDLLKRWKYIGSVQNGILLYIDPDTISYPSEQVVNVLMRASVNNTEYIDMLAINCSESMLRILEERNGNNPVMSAYSDEWREITPESMVLYTSTCQQQK